MVVIEQYNLLAGPLVQTSTSTSAIASELTRVEGTKYEGIAGQANWVLEVTYTNTSTASATFSAANFTSVTLAASTATSTIVRSSSSNVTVADFDVQSAILNLSAAGTATVKSARIIVYLDSGATTAPLLSTQKQIDIATRQLATTVTATNTLQPLVSPRYWTYTAANWDGTLTCYGECTYLGSSTTGNKTLVIQQDNGSFASWTTVATMLSASSGATTATKVRSTSFTPVDGRNYRFAFSNSSTMSTVSIFNAKIIIDQERPDGIDFNPVFSGASTEDQSITNIRAQSFTGDGSAIVAVSFKLARVGANTSNYIYAYIYAHSGTYGTSSVPTGSSLGNSSLVSVPLINTTGNDVIFPFATPVNTVAGTKYVAVLIFNGGYSSSNYVQMYQSTGGSTHAGNASTGTSVFSLTPQSNIDYVFGVYNTNGGITKSEHEYLITNTAFAAGTARQDQPVKFDPTDWSGVTLDYKLKVDASASNTSVVVLDNITANATLTGSTVTSPNNVGTSASITTMPASAANLDAKATTNSGSIYGARMITYMTKGVTSSAVPTYFGYIIGG